MCLVWGFQCQRIDNILLSTPSSRLLLSINCPRMKNLVTLNFQQEAREADLRYNLVRVRENAESVAFYRGEVNEKELLFKVSGWIENLEIESRAGIVACQSLI